MYKKVVKKQKARKSNSFFVKKGDLVEVVSGQGQSSTGKVSKVLVSKKQVIVEGVNLRTKHVKPMKEGDTGQIVRRELPIHISNVKSIIE